MRLIDADMLIKEIREVYEYEYPTASGAFDEFVTMIIPNIIRNQTTVDAVPVVHGKWLHDESGANFCSECMEYAYEDEEYRMMWHTQYCPHCGAKMDGKDSK